MKGFFEARKLLAVAVAAALAATASQVSLGQQNDDDDEEEEELEFEEADLFFELNDTDGDLGLQGFVDGEAWKSLEIAGPESRNEEEEEPVLMSIWLRNALRRQGLTEFSFESEEPGFDELTPAQFFRRFPQGIYEIEGITLEGQEVEAEIRLSHVMAAPPETIAVNGIPQAPNCDSDELPEVSGPVTIDWSPVTRSHPTIGIPNVDVIVRQYQFIGEIERDSNPEEVVFSVDLPRNVTQFTLPVEFTRLSPDGEVKYELITMLSNGNLTAVESCFEIE
ncbi:MAG TPA: hypothetical protein VJN00_05910 [Steroidobacteraceae bacterium]|jgi:hypothetical protein|nr:hypothetical protein [Steroidobacteraceae bacterium]